MRAILVNIRDRSMADIVTAAAAAAAALQAGLAMGRGGVISLVILRTKYTERRLSDSTAHGQAGRKVYANIVVGHVPKFETANNRAGKPSWLRAE